MATMDSKPPHSQTNGGEDSTNTSANRKDVQSLLLVHSITFHSEVPEHWQDTQTRSKGCQGHVYKMGQGVGLHQWSTWQSSMLICGTSHSQKLACLADITTGNSYDYKAVSIFEGWYPEQYDKSWAAHGLINHVNNKPVVVATLIIPIGVCYYSELSNAITSTQQFTHQISPRLLKAAKQNMISRVLKCM